MILILLLVGVGLRMVAAYPVVEARWWLLAGFLLWCGILTRHINALLIGLLPLTFILLAFGQWWRSSRTGLQKGTDAPRFAIRQQLRAVGWSIAIGVIALLLASGYTDLLCRKAHIRPRSEVGLTFLWRLNFLPHAANRHARRSG